MERIELADDGATARIELEETMNAARITELIEALANLRAQMTPALPVTEEAASRMAVASFGAGLGGLAMYTRPLADGQFLLAIHDSGLGWIARVLSPAAAATLCERLQGGGSDQATRGLLH